MLDCTIFCSRKLSLSLDIRFGRILLHGDLGVDGLLLDPGLPGVDGEGDDDGMGQAGVGSDTLSVLNFLQGDPTVAGVSASGMPNLYMSTGWTLAMGLRAEREGVMDSLMFGPSYIATMSFTV